MFNCYKLLFITLLLPCSALSESKSTAHHSIYQLTLTELIAIQVVESASGFEQNAQQAPATITVINTEQWQTMGARTLSDVLRTIPGVHVSKPPISPYHKKFVFRGLSGVASSKIKILIDGEPFENLQVSGLFYGFNLPLNSFERIEVLKGPGSAIYGADAFGGIINLITHKNKELPTVAGIRYGNFNTKDVYAQGSLAIADSQLQWSMGYISSDDDPGRIVTADLQSIFDQDFGTNASLTPGPIDERYEVFNLLTKWQWHNTELDFYTWRNFDLGKGPGVAQALDPGGKFSHKFDHYKLTQDFSAHVDGQLHGILSYKQQKMRSFLNVFPAGAILPIGADGNLSNQFVGFTLFEDGYIGTPGPQGHSTTFRIIHLFEPMDNHLLRWELGYEKQSFKVIESKNFGPGVIDGTQAVVDNQLTDVTGTNYVFIPDVKRHFSYLSLHDEWQINQQIKLSAGIRYDKYSDFGSTTNPRLGLIWQLSDKFTWKLFAGSAFKAPSIEQLYSQNNPVTIGNAQLKQESVDTYEIGSNLEYLVNENLVLSLNIFNYHAKDLIGYAPVTDVQTQGSMAQNLGEQKGRGLEFIVKWKPQSQITVDFNYSYISTEDEFGADIIDIPQEMAFFAINWQPLEHYNLSFDTKWISNRQRSLLDTRAQLSDYYMATLTLQRDNIFAGIDASLNFTNLLDKSAKEPSDGNIPDDYPLAGRKIMLELSYQF